MAAPLIAGMPAAQDLTEGYTIRITAVDPLTGNLMPGVTVGLVVLTADLVAAGAGVGGGDAGNWFLVPGPGA